jgi:hypothetical protein
MTMRKLLLLLMVITCTKLTAQSVPSPEQFLGYGIGKQFTPHYKIINYFKALAAARPDMIRLEKYGETYEGRELFIAYVSTSGNLQNLETIRQNNLALAGISAGNANAQTGIVWLSYNVHGNEPSSSEAAMQTAYTLLNPQDTRTKQWLQNTVVIIDPCLNPDGRDRYVNWYNAMKGTKYNVDPQSREHSEPWPGGRSNHYNFDLNRDWAWQTQIETQQRLKKYNEWMPQIHVDFHEQGYNEPYYFAPAAEPFHEAITPWQREMQTIIGKNNARYFDQNNWLYFTKERFDLFYPSYGDTYPTYNGAIGMTFEQGGHSRGGLGVVTNDGDTLTLVDRVKHHTTTGLSTIEIASQQNAKMLSEFKKFFDDSRNAQGSEYKTYVLSSNNLSKLKAITDLFTRNGIAYGTLSNKNVKGYNYFNGKEENIVDEGYNIAVSAYQPRGVLARVLLEPKGKLSDSATYDITAWSLPYAFGIKSYGVKEKLDIKTEDLFKPSIKSPTNTYGYVKEWKSVDDAKFLASLLNNGVRVRFAEKQFRVGTKVYEPGSLIVIKTSNQHIDDLEGLMKKITDSLKTSLEAIGSGFVDKGADVGSPDVKVIKAPKVAMFTGEQSASLSAGEIWHLFEQQLNYPISLLNAAEIGRVNLNNYDVVILPDGNFRFLSDKTSSEKLRQFVSSGGKLIAFENSVSQIAALDWGLKLKTDKEKEDATEGYDRLKKYGDRERNDLVNSIPGAIYKTTVDNTHPLAFGYPDYYYTLKQDNTQYDFLKSGWNVGYIKKDNLVSGFVGNKLKQKLNDLLVFGEMNIGSGSVVLFADDPIFRLFWENGKLLVANAVFLVNQ